MWPDIEFEKWRDECDRNCEKNMRRVEKMKGMSNPTCWLCQNKTPNHMAHTCPRCGVRLCLRCASRKCPVCGYEEPVEDDFDD